uniref:Adhesion G protein-coupled receptor F5 n=1 Tax=Chrysemys picta bellii TaxID=8478 RepID=A0A8C3IAY6_CHRPI|nr:adhesion G protein-coupled receptor F5 isoform X1 [Chrysemys picta bellii]XP_023956821.1 adhesion G protein-coupled receptor F5 isoform X1 [Chrysemys picta bellii]XP_042704598.1 adhesion G protein-coupled receptor F5 isoform X1 [Chrysemys picta bellii]
MGKQRTEIETEAHTWPGSALSIAGERPVRGAWHLLSFRFCNKILGEMPSLGITVFCFLLLIVTTSTHASMEVNFDPFVHLSPDSENGTEENVPTELHRQKRQVATFGLSPLEYKIDIEISYTDPSLLEAIKDYFKNLSFPVIVNTSDAAMNISSLSVTTVCSLTSNNETHCFCESGYRWPAAMCSANSICPSTNPTQEEICDCITQVPSQGPYCQLQPDDQTHFSVSPEDIFQGDTVIMKCEIPLDTGNGIWYHSGHVILNSTRHSISTTSVLKITNVTQDDTGPYTCIFVNSSVNSTLVFKATRNITVAAINIVQSGDTEVICDGTKVSLSCCIDGNIQFFTTSWRPNKAINIVGTTSFTPNCTEYTLQANQCQCPNQPNSEITYTCELSTGNGAIRSKAISVTYVQIANVKIVSSAKAQVSEGHSFNLTCTSDVSNCDNVTWEIRSRMIDSRLYSCNLESPSKARSVLTVKSATQAWNGTYICTFSQKSLPSSANITVEIVPLPLKQNIVLDPMQGFIQCNVPQVLKCCINGMENYNVIFTVQQSEFKGVKNTQGNQTCYTYNYSYTESCSSRSDVVANCTFVNRIQDKVTSSPMKLSIIPENKVMCSGSIGVGQQGAQIKKPCPGSKDVNGTNITIRGTVIYVCNTNWKVASNSCISDQINTLLNTAESLVYGPQAEEELPTYLETLHNTTIKELQEINTSPANLMSIITILHLVSNIPIDAEQRTMTNFLSTVNIIINSSRILAWKPLNNETANSSLLLDSVERFSRSLRPVNNTIPPITDTNLQLQGIVITENSTSDYNKNFTFSNSANLSGNVLINSDTIKNLKQNSTIITVAFSNLSYILPNPSETVKDVNGLVMMTTTNSTLPPDFQISMTFAKSNLSMKEPQCVFWNNSLSAAVGGWDDTGCHPKDEGDNIICICSHLTSFSILMSFDQGSSKAALQSLDYITYIGLSISIVSLMICILIESLVWKYVTKTRTSYMRHVCILNIAVSLLIADSWFIVAAFLPDKEEQVTGNVCIAATFFIHLFYLSMFFWMLALGLMIFYRLVFILHDTSKTIQKAVAFSLGYGCPLIISVITIAVTQPHNTYKRENACWLNWEKSKALLAFVIPALIIVAVNSIIAVVILVKILRPAIGEKPSKQERSSLIQAIKNVATLTPLFGLTWGFGVATLNKDSSIVFHILFTLLNAFQGLFILVFGTLRDKKVVEALLNKYSLGRWSTQQTKLTSLGDSAPAFSMSSPFSGALNNLFGKAGKYKISSTETTGSFSEHTSNTYSGFH